MPYYHVYNRGAHKAPIFHEPSDYKRMLKLLYIANNFKPFEMREFGEKNIFEIPREQTMVDIVAYCLMPNHIHLGIWVPDPDPRLPGNPEASGPEVPLLTKFTIKIFTGYSKYYNLKYDHSGTIWQGPHKKKYFEDKDLPILIDYIHLNPYGLITPNMTKEARKEHPEKAWAYSREYEYSSLRCYIPEVAPREQTPILSTDQVKIWNLGGTSVNTTNPRGGT